ncbi:hypothetical protein V8E53_003963, partial [Lactarius tabidus]
MFCSKYYCSFIVASIVTTAAYHCHLGIVLGIASCTHPTPPPNDSRSGHCLPCCHDIDNVFITVQEASLPRCTVRAINSSSKQHCGVCPSTPRTLATFQELERTRTKEGGREILDTLRLVAIDHRLGHRLVRGRRFEARDTFS